MLCRKSEMRATRKVPPPAAAEGAADEAAADGAADDAAADAATDGAATDGAAADAAAADGGAAEGDAGVPAHAAPISVIAARTAGKRAFICLLLSRLPCTGTASASCNRTTPVSTYYSTNEQRPRGRRSATGPVPHSGGI